MECKQIFNERTAFQQWLFLCVDIIVYLAGASVATGVSEEATGASAALTSAV